MNKDNLVYVIIGAYVFIAIMVVIMPVIIDWYDDKDIRRRIKKLKGKKKPSVQRGK